MQLLIKAIRRTSHDDALNSFIFWLQNVLYEHIHCIHTCTHLNFVIHYSTILLCKTPYTRYKCSMLQSVPHQTASVTVRISYNFCRVKNSYSIIYSYNEIQVIQIFPLLYISIFITYTSVYFP